MNTLVTLLSRHRRAVLFAMLLMLAGGVFALFHLKREIEPALRTDHAVITATLPGASARELAETVTRPVEDALRRIGGIDGFDSRTYDGIALLTVKFDKRSGDTVEIRERLRNRLAELHASLGGNIVGLTGPRIDDAAAAPCDLVAGIAAPAGDLRKLRESLPAVTRALRACPLVADVRVEGLPAERIVIGYGDAELAEAGFSPQMVASVLKAQSFVAPGGYFDDGKSLAVAHADARLKSIDELRAVGVLDPTTGRATVLDRILDVKVEPGTPAGPVVTVSGAAGIRISVTRSSGADLGAFSDAVLGALNRGCAEAKLAPAVVLLDNAAFIRADYRDFADGLLVGGVLLSLLLVAFMGLRTGLVVALAVPLVVLCTLAALQILGFRLNIVVLAALTIAAGVVADNHIVVAQFVSRRLARGETRSAALAESFRLLAGPLLAATLVTVVGFLPVRLADHIAGEYLADLLPVMAIALFFSYLFAFTVTPFFCSGDAKEGGFVVRMEQWYKSALLRLFATPVRAMVSAVVVVAGGLALFAARPSAFFPANDRALLAVEVIRPAGASVSAVASDLATIDAGIETTLKTTGLSATRLTLAGGGVPRFSENMPPEFAAPGNGVALIAFGSAGDAVKFRSAFGNGPTLPGAFVRTRAIGGGPAIVRPVKVVLRGTEESLTAISAEAWKIFSGIPSLAGARMESGDDLVKWRVLPKRRECADKGVTPADIAFALNSVVNGLPCFELGTDELAMPVIVRAKRAGGDFAEPLKDAYVYPAKGRPCLLSDVAVVESYKGPFCVERDRGEPVLTLVADAAPGADPYAVEAEAVAKLSGLKGVIVSSEGLAKNAAEASRAIVDVIPWALALIFLILIPQTRSWRLNLVVLAVIPFGVAGAGYGLAIMGLPSGFMPLIGLTAMAGIAVNIAIVMVAALTDSEKEIAGVSVDQRLAASAASRAEPILLSALCAVGGMAPLYAFGGPLWQGMVVTLISGLLLAVALLMVVIPVAFRRRAS